MNNKLTSKEHIHLWEKSKLSRRAYAMKNGVNPNTFTYWLRREKEKTQKQDFIPLEFPSPSDSRTIVLRIHLNLYFFRIEYLREKK